MKRVEAGTPEQGKALLDKVDALFENVRFIDVLAGHDPEGVSRREALRMMRACRELSHDAISLSLMLEEWLQTIATRQAAEDSPIQPTVVN